MIVAIIPARGGSKRIPRKNVKHFCGKPMISWAIAAAREARVFDRILVSTDDEEIAAVASAFGAEAPFRRPSALADGHTPMLPVIRHAIEWLVENHYHVNLVCCIYATAAFLRPQDIREGLEILRAHPDAEFAFSVTTYAFPIFRALQLRDDGTLAPLWEQYELSRSQDLPQVWHDAGQFYWGRASSFSGQGGVFSARSYPVALPRHLVQDIDTSEDWEQAELMFRSLRR